MADRKRPKAPLTGFSEPPVSKVTRVEVPRRAEGPPNSTLRGRGGRRRGRGRGNYNVPQTSSRGQRPFPTAPHPIDANRLLSLVTCSSLFYENCRTSILDAFPEHVPSTFEDAEHYVRTFLPLLYEEARESIKSSFGDAREQDQYWSAEVLSVDAQGGGWVKVELVLGRFFGRPTAAQRLFQNHLTVLTTVRPPKRDPVEHLQKKLNKSNPSPQPQKNKQPQIPPAALVALIVQWDRDSQRLTLRTRPICEQHGNDAAGPCHQALECLRQFPQSWWLFPTGGLVTQQREFDILQSLDKIPIKNAVLQPDRHLSTKIEDLPRDMPPEMQGYIQGYIHQRFDPAQADAILLCTAHFSRDVVHHDQQTLPILLIQGPPGTGKTHTVEGILNLWHLVQFQRYYRRVIDQYKCADTTVIKKAELANTRTQMQPRILVCAPSNAAVDELLERILRTGFRDSQGKIYRPNLVRVGAEDAPYSEEVRHVLLERLVSSYMTLSKTEWELRHEQQSRRVHVLEQEVAHIEQTVLTNRNRVDTLGGTLLAKMETLDRCEADIRRLKLVECVVDSACANDRLIRESLELSFLDSAEMVFTTLSSSGKKVLSKVNRGFETVLIDEAAQAAEVSTLQPLAYGCQQCVLVGDPQQLPATIISQRGRDLNMERSLFGRLQEGGAPVKLLQTQYRMHPFIRTFPSSYFYNGQLEDGRNIKERPAEAFYTHDLLKPYVLFDVSTGVHERQGGSSLQNQVEANLAVALYKELRDFVKNQEQQALQNGLPPPPWPQVGVLTPYRSQTKCLTETFLRLLGADVTNDVKIMTVDSCQGKQLDVVIFSCVRGSIKASGVGFVADIRRMNVAITRARKALWILGNFGTLISHPAWAALHEDAVKRECIVVQSTAQSLFPNQNLFQTTPPNQGQEMDYRDPRVGVIKPLTEGEAPEVTDATSQTTDGSVIEANNPKVLVQPSAQSTPQQHPVQLPDAIPTSLTSGAASQPMASAEVCSVSTAASDTERESRTVTPAASSLMVIRQSGPPQTIGPYQGDNSAFLLVDAPSGMTAFPIEVLFQATPGFDARLLQNASEGSSETALALLDRVKQCFK